MFEYFYNEILRRTIIAFRYSCLMALLLSKWSSKHIRVPLAYGPTQKFLGKIRTSNLILNKATCDYFAKDVF